jgi:hypothetical protein
VEILNPEVRGGRGDRVAWITVLGPSQAQIDYRLREGAGCDQVTYRLAGDGAGVGAGEDACGELAGEQEAGRG